MCSNLPAHFFGISRQKKGKSEALLFATAQRVVYPGDGGVHVGGAAGLRDRLVGMDVLEEDGAFLNGLVHKVEDFQYIRFLLGEIASDPAHADKRRAGTFVQLVVKAV